MNGTVAALPRTAQHPRIQPAATSLFRRGCMFYAIGFPGIGIQILALAALQEWLGLHYLPATVLAVEAAILLNFLGHQRWTWADRPAGPRERLRRLARFHMAAGLLSIAGNLLLMSLLVGRLGLPVLPANLAAIGACSMLNFLVSHRWVFVPGSPAAE